jgi:hypothetical protein
MGSCSGDQNVCRYTPIPTDDYLRTIDVEVKRTIQKVHGTLFNFLRFICVGVDFELCVLSQTKTIEGERDDMAIRAILRIQPDA